MSYEKTISILAFVTLSTWAFGQENSITLSGGYSFANVEDTDVKATGWRINGLYEFNPSNGKFAHGLSIGYVSISGDETSGVNKLSYDIVSWPIYYAPKFLFGNEKVKGFIKGAIGYQFSNLKRTGTLVEFKDHDGGFAGGGGAGLLYFINEKVFLNAEYELIWLGNSYYKDGWLNTASIGVGFRF